ncbi:MAG: pentapeptide repeat-containing protein [Marmoricola sp.]|nr:pentapeptide repeat-containing protein [Marmoricola sp.]
MTLQQADLHADCSACVGLCCVVPAFSVSSDFALDKPAHTPCPHLAGDFSCGIHAELRERGFPGCTVYDCFGAGQRVVASYAASHPGRTWRDDPHLRKAIFEDFETVERLHELLWYLADALARPQSRPLRAELEGVRDAVERAAAAPAGAEVERWQARADVLLGEASGLVRRPAGPDLRGRDLAGQDLRGRHLVAGSLRGAVLIGADLRGLDLSDVDLLGADVRGADVSGADLSTSLFLTRMQVAAARGDAATRLPDGWSRPAHYGRGHG